MKWISLGNAQRAHFTIYGKVTLCGLEIPEGDAGTNEKPLEWRCSTCSRRAREIDQSEPPAGGVL